MAPTSRICISKCRLIDMSICKCHCPFSLMTSSCITASSRKSSMVLSTWRFVAECTAYPKLASLPTSFSRLALLATDTLKSHICLGYGNISHALFGSIFVSMTLASNILVMIISNISLLPYKQKPTALLKIGKATSTVASPSIGIMHSSRWILTCPSMFGSNLSNMHTQHRQSHSTAPYSEPYLIREGQFGTNTAGRQPPT